MSEYLTTDELAELVRTPAETCRYWRSIGKGPESFKIGRRVLYARADVDEWLAAAKATA
jgi:excisionase family DNA binding protein